MASSLASPGQQADASRSKARAFGLVGKAMQAGAEPVSPASAAAFRIIFGLLGAAAVVRFAAKGWVSDLYVEPAHHLGYYGFGWVQAWPGWGMHAHFALLGAREPLRCPGVPLAPFHRRVLSALHLHRADRSDDVPQPLLLHQPDQLHDGLLAAQPDGVPGLSKRARGGGEAGHPSGRPVDTPGADWLGLRLRGDCEAEPRLAASRRAAAHLALQQHRYAAHRSLRPGTVAPVRHELGGSVLRSDHRGLAALEADSAPLRMAYSWPSTQQRGYSSRPSACFHG